MPEPLPPAPPRQIIRNVSWLVAWDEAAQSHVYRRDIDLTVEGDTVAAIGPADHADAVEIDGRGSAILPGFVDIHAHPSSEPMLKGLTDEVGSRQLYMSSLYEYLPLFEADPEGRRAATEVALCELMQSGVTTVCDLSAAREDWLDTLGASGMRVSAAPMFRSGRWYTPNGHEVRYAWDEQAGREGLDRALRVIDRARQHRPSRRDRDHGGALPDGVFTARHFARGFRPLSCRRGQSGDRHRHLPRIILPRSFAPPRSWREWSPGRPMQYPPPTSSRRPRSVAPARSAATISAGSHRAAKPIS
jgi:cytosine/adenosine deaminase-related metal-dependent hydrolase